MDEIKNKKKTLTISSNLKKTINISDFKKDGKKSFSIEKKKNFKSNREFVKPIKSSGKINTIDKKKKI